MDPLRGALLWASGNATLRQHLPRSRAVRKTVASPEFTRATEKLLVAPAFLHAAEFGKMIAREDAEIARTVKALDLRQDAK